MLEAFEADPDTDSVALIGEIGGRAENEAASYIAAYMTKPVAAFIAGRSAPPFQRLGHAGAVARTENETASAKISALREAGVRIAESPDAFPYLLS